MGLFILFLVDFSGDSNVQVTDLILTKKLKPLNTFTLPKKNMELKHSTLNFSRVCL